MARAYTRSRWAATADRPGPDWASPFRVETETVDGAAEMIAKRQAEIAALEALLVVPGKTRVERNALRARLRASRANLRSWLDYLAKDAPPEKRAVVIPD